jgi:hypothetical protein
MLKKYNKIIIFSLILIGVFSCGAYLNAAAKIEFVNPLQYNTVEQFVTAFLGALRDIIVLISVLFIVIGGILYMTSAGNDQRIETAKKAITAALIGLSIGIAAPTFVQETYVMLGATDVPDVEGASSFAAILQNVLNFLLGIMGVIAIIMLVLAGILYMTSAGDESKIDTAKKMTKWAIIGVAVALSAIFVVTQIASFFATS